MLYKDRKIVKNNRSQAEALKEIATMLEEADKCDNKENYFRKKLLNGMVGSREHKPKHSACKGFNKPQKGKLKEKRICHCMYYYEPNSSKCINCTLENKWNNIGKIKVTEFEWPTKYVYENVGGMDLILDDTYAVEIKPPNSQENLSRMIAEILTYTIEPDIKGKKYIPAIGLFDIDTNKQIKQFKELIKSRNEDMIRIMNDVNIFIIKVSSLEDNIIDYQFIRYEAEDDF